MRGHEIYAQKCGYRSTSSFFRLLDSRLQPGKHLLARAASETSSPSAFEPLDRWKAAVLSGDRTALAALYTISPPAQAKIPQGQTQDPAEEPALLVIACEARDLAASTSKSSKSRTCSPA